MNIKPETYKRLSQIENVVATKEANGDLSALMKTLMLCGDELDIYCGNDDQSAAFTLLGGKGTISVLSNIMPQASHDIVTEMRIMQPLSSFGISACVTCFSAT